MENAVLSAFLERAGVPVSGEELAKMLDVSRNAVWKAVNKLKKQGYEVLSKPNAGYVFSAEQKLVIPERAEAVYSAFCAEKAAETAAVADGSAAFCMEKASAAAADDVASFGAENTGTSSKNGAQTAGNVVSVKIENAGTSRINGAQTGNAAPCNNESTMPQNAAAPCKNIDAMLQNFGTYPKISIIAVDEIDSTNTALKKMAEAGAAEGTIVTARLQTGGKGRLGRTFLSPKGSGLYFSLLLRPDLPFSACRTLTTTAAVAVSRAVERLVPGAKCRIKWVNDVFLHGKKVCGILTEAAIGAETGKLDYAVLGIGINVTVPEGGFPEDLRSVAGAISEDGVDFSTLLGAVVAEFFTFYGKNGAACLAEYRARQMLTGMPVIVFGNGDPYPAVVLGVSDDFGLLVEREDGTKEELSSGEVSVRPR